MSNDLSNASPKSPVKLLDAAGVPDVDKSSKQDFPKCSAYANHDSWGRGTPCSRHASVTRDGKPYCKQHDPVAIAERRELRDQKWQKKYDAESKQRLREHAAIAAMQGIDNPAAFMEKVRTALAAAQTELREWRQGMHDDREDDDAETLVQYALALFPSNGGGQ